MSIVENVWDHLKQMEEWVKIDQGFIDRLYDSMLQRVDALQKAQRGSTSY
ncbi:hypothetical protein Hypma_003470 [Hypsizygus marmoreus]|uniref:Uncharacterized protein n=1 Tax=Hypsizygus marmoreus TaxID=39966 RepID=A0A369J9C9_HYPMA|nr:hypothetical protein Hypma_003470 [Hypsizygus marmoreus]